MVRGALARAALPPLLAFAVARAVLGAAAVSAGVPPSRPGSWCRFDCAHYMRIAQHGYELAPCPADSHDAGLWCGNAAWLPGYPLLTRAALRLGLPPRGAALAVSALFALATLALLWAALAGALAGPGAPPRAAAAAALALAAFFPGAVYAHAISPLGVFGWPGPRLAPPRRAGPSPGRRPRRCGGRVHVSAGPAPRARPGGRLPARARDLAARAGPRHGRRRLAAGGFAAVMILQHLDTGHWWGFALVQGDYHYSLRNPLVSLARRIAPLFLPPFEGAGEAPAAQTLLVGLLVACGAVVLRLSGRGSTVTPEQRFVALYVAAAWLLPLVIGEEEGGLHRREAALLPLVLLTARLPAPVQAVLAGVAAVVAYALALLFFRGQLV